MHPKKRHLSNNTSPNSVSRHSGNHSCGCWNRGHQGPVLWQIPGHEQEGQTLCISKFFWSLLFPVGGNRSSGERWFLINPHFQRRVTLQEAFCLEFLQATNQYIPKSWRWKKSCALTFLLPGQPQLRGMSELSLFYVDLGCWQKDGR